MAKRLKQLDEEGLPYPSALEIEFRFPRDNNRPLWNLFVSTLQNMGLETEAFGLSTGTLDQINR